MKPIKMYDIVGWRRSVSIYHIIRETKNDEKLKVALDVLGCKSRKTAEKTANTVEDLVEKLGSLEAVETMFARIEPYADSAKSLWNMVSALAENGVKDISTYGGKFSDLKGIGVEYGKMLNNCRRNLMEDMIRRVDMHIRVPRCLKDRYKQMAKEDGVSVRDLATKVLMNYASTREPKR